MPQFELNKSEQFVESRIVEAPSPGKHAARSAIRHIRKAYALAEIDAEMAYFRAITGEEEAARAVFHALQRHQYKGASHLRWKDHVHKAAVIPFLAAVKHALSEIPEFDGAFVVDESGERTELRVRVRLPTPDGRRLDVLPIPPLHATVTVDNLPPTFIEQLSRIAGGEDLKAIEDYVRREANARNTPLYATEQGVPNLTGNLAGLLARKRINIYSLLLTFIVIDEHRSVQSFAQQGLDAFLAVLGLLDRRLRSLYPLRDIADDDGEAPT